MHLSQECVSLSLNTLIQKLFLNSINKIFLKRNHFTQKQDLNMFPFKRNTEPKIGKEEMIE